jgi:hypothetical protein
MSEVRPRFVHDATRDPCPFCGVEGVERSAAALDRCGNRRICGKCLRDCAGVLKDFIAEIRGDTTEQSPVGDHESPTVAGAVEDILHELDQLRPGDGRPVSSAGESAQARARGTASECSFCQLGVDVVFRLISGPGVNICDRCVGLAVRPYQFAAIRRRYGWLHDKLVEVLFRHDPLGLNYEDNKDEYVPEVRRLLVELEHCSSAAILARNAKYRNPKVSCGVCYPPDYRRVVVGRIEGRRLARAWPDAARSRYVDDAE